jgi:hypothetical protein
MGRRHCRRCRCPPDGNSFSRTDLPNMYRSPRRSRPLVGQLHFSSRPAMRQRGSPPSWRSATTDPSPQPRPRRPPFRRDRPAHVGGRNGGDSVAEHAHRVQRRPRRQLVELALGFYDDMVPSRQGRTRCRRPRNRDGSTRPSARAHRPHNLLISTAGKCVSRRQPVVGSRTA